MLYLLGQFWVGVNFLLSAEKNLDLVVTSPEPFKIAEYCPFGLQNKTKMISSKYTKFYFFWTIGSTAQISSKHTLLKLIASLFICSRVVISEEPSREAGKYVFHVLMHLHPGMLWKSVYAHIHHMLVNKNCNVVPLASFSRGVKFQLAADQAPFFWNFYIKKAVRILNWKQWKRSYASLDVPANK